MIISATSSFVPCPEGVHDAVCVDAVDLGMQETSFGKKHRLRITWEVDELMDNGKRFVCNKRYTASLHDKSTLYKDLRSWRGKPFTKEELTGFDTEKLIGVPAKLIVQHDERDGVVYANVTAVLKADNKLKPSGGYVRQQDRVTTNGNGGNGHGREESDPVDEDEVPF